MMAFSNVHPDVRDQASKHYGLSHPITYFNFCNPAYTEASFVSCHSAAYFTTVRRLSNEGSFIGEISLASLEHLRKELPVPNSPNKATEICLLYVE
jgi:hypothetical protein